MKKFIFAFLFVSFFISCAKTDNLVVCGCSVVTPSLYDRGYKYSTDIDWIDYNTTDTVKNDSITLHSLKQDRELILKFPFTAGLTVVEKIEKNFTATYIRHNTGASTTQVFKLDSTATNTLNYSANAEGVSGNFKFIFKLRKGTGVVSQDTIRAYYPGGVFQVKLKK